ncbi:chloroplast sensor kinase, chloroplastic isoform X2 [Actinidia eriantha]|uniref:chloroplast sensor kinase, chloroplastic isoform X2 n=1 Tax=Actinidia eriantha TaxID=165200 RepID=UPI00258F8F19|nr:chloroplast sensor kinase, chloroplastic isoform X2 [Actinidia eriantha]
MPVLTVHLWKLDRIRCCSLQLHFLSLTPTVPTAPSSSAPTTVPNSPTPTPPPPSSAEPPPLTRPLHSLSSPPTPPSPPSQTAPPSNNTTLQNPNPSHSPLRHVCVDESEGGGGGEMVSSASAVAWAIRRASPSPVEFVQRMDEHGKSKGRVVPSPEFQRLCLEQLDLFRRIVHADALLSVFVRPSGSYVMDQLELRRVTVYPGVNAADIVILFSNFSIPSGLRAAEDAISSQQAEFIPECRAVVFPMVKHPFVVGFLVAELPKRELQMEEHDIKGCQLPEEACAFPPCMETKSREIKSLKDNELEMYKFTAEQRLNAVNISRSLTMAYVMDQKAMLLQQSSWQNNTRMSSLVEQIRGPLSSIRTLSKMLSLHMKRSEISYDIVEDILVQGDRIRDAVQQLQDAVYLTKANIVRYNDETLKKMHRSSSVHPESVRSQLSTSIMETEGSVSLSSISKDVEMPMPPLALAPLQQQDIRPSNVSAVLADLVGAVEPLARKQERVVELCELSKSLHVDVEEPALRQALSNLIEGALLRTHVGGKVEIASSGAPAGGALVIIDDDGPDMHYMTQMHSLTPFGVDLLSENMVEDNMTWNFVAGLTVAREILESYGCVVRVISPRRTDAAIGAGGSRVELWLPSSAAASDQDSPAQEA